MIGFDEWMKEVNKLLVEKIGFEAEDMPDHCWMELFEDGYSPEEAADDYAEEHGWDW